jgi:hypothetical protein
MAESIVFNSMASAAKDQIAGDAFLPQARYVLRRTPPAPSFPLELLHTIRGAKIQPTVPLKPSSAHPSTGLTDNADNAYFSPED